MQTTIKTFGASALLSFLLTLPLILMEIINRRNFNEEFPYLLFFGLWLNLFFISLIALPIILSRWSSLYTGANPKSALILSIAFIFIVTTIALLSSSVSEPTQGANSEFISVFGFQVPSQLIAFIFLSLPVLAGIIASQPIVRTLQAGGSLFAHPLHLIIVGVILLIFTVGVVGLIVDQWSCFMGVPNCD